MASVEHRQWRAASSERLACARMSSPDDGHGRGKQEGAERGDPTAGCLSSRTCAHGGKSWSRAWRARSAWPWRPAVARPLARRPASRRPAPTSVRSSTSIFLMNENRSFDHYFGSYKGVRGFDDPAARAAGSLRAVVARGCRHASCCRSTSTRPPPTPSAPSTCRTSGRRSTCAGTAARWTSSSPPTRCRSGRVRRTAC